MASAAASSDGRQNLGAVVLGLPRLRTTVADPSDLGWGRSPTRSDATGWLGDSGAVAAGSGEQVDGASGSRVCGVGWHRRTLAETAERTVAT
ncbi:hypothetical protein Drorol1_Dr00000151 [Drosera rotundifolia]